MLRLPEAARTRLYAAAKSKGLTLAQALEQAVMQWAGEGNSVSPAEHLEEIGELDPNELETGADAQRKLEAANATHPLKRWAKSESHARAPGLLPRKK